MQTHEIKLETQYCDAVRGGQKSFEIRYNDRGYQSGDAVIFRPWCSKNRCYDTQQLKIRAKITYVSNYAQKEGWCVFAIEIKDQNQ